MSRELRASRGTSRLCPCGTGRPYRECCAPFHFGDREAPDAVSLMRSRYSAFSVGNAAYLWQTLHTGHEDRGRDKEDVLRELREAIQENKYMGLRILDSLETGSSAEVLFLAQVFVRGTDRSFVELSDFLHDGAGWRYLCGTSVPRSRITTPLGQLTLDAFTALTRE